MMVRKAALAFAGMVVLLAGTAAGAAAVDTFAITPSGRVSATSVGALTFTEPGGRLATIACNVTLAGTLASSADKLAGTTVGGVTSASAGGCSGGTATFLGPSAERPWPIVYNEILGTLPTAVTGVQLAFEGVAVRAVSMFGTCLYAGDLQTQLAVTGTTEYSGETITSLVNHLGLTSGFLCPRTGVVRGALRLATRVALTPAFAPAQPLTANPPKLRFDEVPPATTVEADVVFTNGDDDILVLDDVDLGGVHKAAYAIDAEDCDEVALPDGDSCTVRVVFEAFALKGMRRGAWLSLGYADFGDGLLYKRFVNLIGTIG